MTIFMEGTVAHLAGSWTLAGVTQSNINSLATALQQMETGDARALQVDCRHITATDSTGMQLLDVWMQCARFRGLEPELVNLPDNLRQSFQSLVLR